MYNNRRSTGALALGVVKHPRTQLAAIVGNTVRVGVYMYSTCSFSDKPMCLFGERREPVLVLVYSAMPPAVRMSLIQGCARNKTAVPSRNKKPEPGGFEHAQRLA